jgi:hypothetical protein
MPDSVRLFDGEASEAIVEGVTQAQAVVEVDAQCSAR